jgi:hypothetical protein
MRARVPVFERAEQRAGLMLDKTEDAGHQTSTHIGPDAGDVDQSNPTNTRRRRDECNTASTGKPV